VKRTFHKIKCPYCEQIISSNGLGWASHMRKHVREGILIERRDGRRRLYFDLVDQKDIDMWESLEKD
jgi:hypothetical protein